MKTSRICLTLVALLGFAVSATAQGNRYQQPIQQDYRNVQPVGYDRPDPRNYPAMNQPNPAYGNTYRPENTVQVNVPQSNRGNGVVPNQGVGPNQQAGFQQGIPGPGVSGVIQTGVQGNGPGNELHNLPPIRRGPVQPKERVSGSMELKNLSAVQFEKKLVAKLGERCVAVANSDPNSTIRHFQMLTADGTQLDLRIDSSNNGLRISGSKPSVSAFAQIAKLLDSVENVQGVETDIMPFHGANYRAVQYTAETLNQVQDLNYLQGLQDGVVLQQLQQLSEMADAGSAQGNMGDVGNMGIYGGNASDVAGQLAQSGLIGPVQVEVIDGLDMLVIRGNQRDVALVKEMIKQIEATGAEQEPEIRIYQMQNTDCQRIGTIVRLLYNEIYGTRRGSINITPLVKPNALLLVGRKESIETTIELIKKLDIPVDPQFEFRVIRLKYANSDSVKNTLDEFFMNREQLGTTLKVTSDYRTNSLIIQANPRDIQEALRMIENLDTMESASVNQVRVIKLLNTTASEMASVLQNALTGTGGTSVGSVGGFGGTSSMSRSSGTMRSSMLEFRTIDTKEGEFLRSGILVSDIRITPDTRTNSIIINAPAESLSLIEALVKELDQLPIAESQVKVFTIINGDATGLYNMLQQLFQTQMGGGGMTGSSSQLVTRPGFSDGESAMIPVRFSVDVRTNSIIAMGSAGDMTVIEAILLRLDEEKMQNRVVTVFRLLNSPVTQIANAVNDYLRNERQVENLDNELFSVYEQFRREVVVVPETVTNSLIVSTTPRFYNDIRKIIKELDDRPPMVVIQVLIAEVQLKNMNEFGVELGLQDSVLFDRSVFTAGAPMPQTVSLPNGTVVNANPGYNFNDVKNPLGNNAGMSDASAVGTQGLTNLGVGRANSSGSGGFVFSASSESVSVLLRALEERQKVNVLGRPQVTALDNERATIQVGQKVPYVKDSQTTTTGMVNSTDYMDVGLILDITPRINNDGLVVMNLYAEKSSAGSDADGITIAVGQNGTPIKSPRITLSKVQTTVSAMDGQTIVLGGLITSEDTRITRAVPVLSRIPVVGRLFEYNSKQCDRREMLVILTPTIIRSEEDAERVKMAEIQRIHWCVSDVMSITTAKNIRVRGDYYTPNESEIIKYDGYVPSESELPSPITMPNVPGAPPKSDLLKDVEHAAPTPAPAPSKPNTPGSYMNGRPNDGVGAQVYNGNPTYGNQPQYR
ncbi:MAG: secretin N-terminal domain-containing protein [Thermoguttaceae bacterium]